MWANDDPLFSIAEHCTFKEKESISPNHFAKLFWSFWSFSQTSWN